MRAKYLQSSLRLVISFALVFLTIFYSSCFDKSGQDQPLSSTDQDVPAIPKPEIDLLKPLEVSQNPKDIAQCDQIKNKMKRGEFANARWGFIAIGLSDGRITCEIEAQKLFNPASIHKLLTSIVALDKLGKDFRIKTSVFSTKKIQDGILDGDLILYGRGAPDIDDVALQSMVIQLKQKGLKKVEGDIVGDESYFKGDNLGDGWTWNDAQWYYGAAASALSINRNQVTISLQNGKPKSDSNYVELSGELKPIEDIEAIGLKRELGTNKVYVWGNGKKLKARIAVHKPALFAARIFKELLEKNGIIVNGNAKANDWKSDKRLKTANAIELVSIQSQTLAETLKIMNKDSVNLYAELILRILGKKFGKEAPDEKPKIQKLRGDDIAGTAVLKKWLKDHNITSDDIAIHDGSGLSRLDLVSPEIIARALVYAAQSEFAETFMATIPVSGKSGTLRNRLKNISGKILAKTGSISYVNSLAGYAKTPDEVIAFVIIFNNQTHKTKSIKTIDSIATILAQNKLP